MTTPYLKIVQHHELSTAANVLAKQIASESKREVKLFAVPRGGVPACYLVVAALAKVAPALAIRVTPFAEEADYFIDDLVDSGKTRDRYMTDGRKSGAQFLALFDKTSQPEVEREWLVFPWEASEEKSIEDAFTRLIQYCGDDPMRGGLIETPGRMAKAWRFWCGGYRQEAAAVLKTFEDGGEKYDEMIHVANIPFYTHCEHHMAPFFGTVTFAYIPDKRIVGLSKMSRLVQVFARRLQVQERLTVQVVDAFCDALAPRGAGIVVKARHLCMESRGICQQGSETTTSALRGVFKTDASARAEFLSLSKGR